MPNKSPFARDKYFNDFEINVTLASNAIRGINPAKISPDKKTSFIFVSVFVPPAIEAI